VLILDAGSGPFTTLGAEVDDIFVDIVACDILADEYIAMMEARDILPWNLVEQENMECLSYGDGIFDIVHCQNALDHTENPREALKEMLRVCKRDGWIYLKHYPNVGDRHNYTGSHHWNLCVFEGDCKVWNREEEFLMSEILEDVAVFMDKGMVVCNWTK
jgi:ubiquinone/menaquinone biosynthesis C-methylase UbiE